MTPEQIHRQIDETTAQIVGLKKWAKRKFGTSDRAPNCAWPVAHLDRLAALKATIKKYRALLAPEHGEAQ